MQNDLSLHDKKKATLLHQVKLPWLFFTLLVFAVLIKLGFWQLDRAEEKIQRLAHIEQLKNHDAIPLTKVISLAESTPKHSLSEVINDLPVLITATFSKEKVFLLDNQTHKNALGYRVFQIAKAGKHTFLVNMGWIAGSVDRKQLPNFIPVSGEYRFKGHIRLMEKGVVLQEQQFNDVSWPLRVQQIEPEKLSLVIGDNLLPFVVYLDEKESLGFVKNWQPIVMPPEKHQAYAFQWFSLAIAWMILMVWVTFKQDNEKVLNNE